ncbi:uncharacterized domain 1-containing protein [Mameliella alba]|uniref:PaaI family thioesterase n=1 Tax=Mameliella alba TaxID=561184 RepID=UPI00088A6CF2|nr:PaaI family thioesterase [Mameliella alba]PTR36810.1 uncharacterized protein (TIGR00369 family) [Mameliella alba]GGF78071.1 thioesterase [Mameliella alba]SDD89564.1 uncharacterized domain 1-containing protein [Mameliella alba]
MTDTDTGEWRPLDIKGFMALMGPLLRATDAGDRGTYGFQTDDRHGNHIGLVHGGVLTSLLDQAIAIRAWKAAERQPTVTVQMDSRFLGAARVGDFLKIRPEIRHATRSLIFVDAEIHSGTGPVATASAIMKITSKTGRST